MAALRSPSKCFSAHRPGLNFLRILPPNIYSSVESLTPRSTRDHAHNLGPSNLASRPRTTRYNTVKIKPGGGGGLYETTSKPQAQDSYSEPRQFSASTAPQGGVGAGLLNSAGMDAKDGVMAVQVGYGTMGNTPPKSKGRDSAPGNIDELSPSRIRERESRDRTANSKSDARDRSQGSIASVGSRSKSKTAVARSGSLSENVVHAGGIKKTVLETTSSSEDGDGSGSGGGRRFSYLLCFHTCLYKGYETYACPRMEMLISTSTIGGGGGLGQTDGADDAEPPRDDSRPEPAAEGSQQSQKKKRRRKKRSAKKGEEQPLMEEGRE